MVLLPILDENTPEEYALVEMDTIIDCDSIISAAQSRKQALEQRTAKQQDIYKNGEEDDEDVVIVD
jgi:hypothetical protein